MECFVCIIPSIHLRMNDQPVDFRGHPRTQELSAPHVYCMTAFMAQQVNGSFAEQGFKEVLRKVPRDQAAQAFEFPAHLGGTAREAGAVHDLCTALDRLAQRARGGKLTLGVFNGLGTGIGDTIVGLTALRCARDRVLAAGGPQFEVDLIVQADAARRVESVARIDPLAGKVVSMPQPLSRIRKYDGLWDFEAYLLDPLLEQTPMVDYYLHRLGVDPALVEPASKNNRLALPQPPKKLATALAGIAGRMLLFHPLTSSAVRSMPGAQARRIAAELVERTECTVASAVPVDFAHPRFVNLAPLSANFVDLCHIVARADRIVTADTSVYHIAAALGIPTVVLFTTLPPELRVKYYPSVAGVLLDGAEQTPYFKGHKKRRDISPEILRPLWEGFDVGAALERLEAVAAQETKKPRP